MGCPETELSLAILDDAQIADLNRRYLKRRGPTNVIAFPMQEGPFGDLTPGLLGDVAISVETARREAKAAGLTFDRRFNELLIHGILHLLGYDHEANEAEAQVMEAKTAELMAMLDNHEQTRKPTGEKPNKIKTKFMTTKDTKKTKGR